MVDSNETNLNVECFKKYRESLIKQDEMLGILFTVFHSVSNNFYLLPNKIKSLVDELCKYTGESELSRLDASINSDIMKINYYDKLDKLHEYENRLVQLAYEESLCDKQLTVQNLSSLNKTDLTFHQAIKKMFELEIESLDIDKGNIELKYQDIITSGKSFLETISIQEDEKSRQDSIKEKSTKIIELCNQISREITAEENLTKFKFSKLYETVNMILIENQTIIENINNSFSHRVLEEFNDDSQKVEENSKIKQEIITEYGEILKELELLKTTLPNYLDNLNSLEERLLNMNIDKYKNSDSNGKENLIISQINPELSI